MPEYGPLTLEDTAHQLLQKIGTEDRWFYLRPPESQQRIINYYMEESMRGEASC